MIKEYIAFKQSAHTGDPKNLLILRVSFVPSPKLKTTLLPLELFKLLKLFALKICTSANFVVSLHREPALGMSALGLYSRVCELAATMLHHSTQHYTTLNNATGEG